MITEAAMGHGPNRSSAGPKLPLPPLPARRTEVPEKGPPAWGEAITPRVLATTSGFTLMFAAVPTTIGPTDPPRLPIMLMKPIAEAAAVAPRNMLGIGQKAGRW